MDEGNSTTKIPYMVFVYRDQLRRLNKHEYKLCKSKLDLTEELVSYSVDRLMEYDKEELMNIKREILYTHELESRIDHMEPKHKYCTKRPQLVDREVKGKF